MNTQSMFTKEQQTGSGQMQLIDQISEFDAKVKELSTKPHEFISDAGHGWLKVSYEDLRVLGIWGKVSTCSYRKDDEVYLEEDLDAATYLKTIFPDGWKTEEYTRFKYALNSINPEDTSFIRNLPHCDT